MYSDQAFTSVGSPGYYDPTTFVEGWNHLDGKAALAFARERHAFKTGDVQRGINHPFELLSGILHNKRFLKPHPKNTMLPAGKIKTAGKNFR